MQEIKHQPTTKWKGWMKSNNHTQKKTLSNSNAALHLNVILDLFQLITNDEWKKTHDETKNKATTTTKTKTKV